MEYKLNHGIVDSCKYHVVLCPKYRRKVLIANIETKLKELVWEVCAEFNSDLEEMEVMLDHVQLLLEVDPQFGIHKAVKTIKGRTSHVLRYEFECLTTRIPSLWTNSCFISTVGLVGIDVGVRDFYTDGNGNTCNLNVIQYRRAYVN